jgi:hypothetical protein
MPYNNLDNHQEIGVSYKVYGAKCHFQQHFSYIISFTGGVNGSRGETHKHTLFRFACTSVVNVE